HCVPPSLSTRSLDRRALPPFPTRRSSDLDICAALWEVGADVTMVQRSSTHVSRSDSLMEMALGALYSESAVASGMTTQKADMTLDRKSTRLNSSHVAISYAVFCLKKKKKT